MKRIILEFIIGLPVVVGLYTLFDFLYCTLITHSPFSFDIKGCSIAVCVLVVIVITLHVIRNRKKG